MRAVGFGLPIKNDGLLDVASGQYELLFRQVNHVDIALVDDEAPAHPDKHIVLELLEHLVEEMKLEGHLAALSIGQHEVRIVAVGTDIDNLVRGDSHQFGAGRYSEPFHGANIRILIESYAECTSFFNFVY